MCVCVCVCALRLEATSLSLLQAEGFHKTVVRMVGEFASVLPDYHTPDIMNLIISYVPHEDDGSLTTITDPQMDGSRHRELVVSLVKCLQAVANSTHSVSLEGTLPESLLSSLSKLLDIDDPGLTFLPPPPPPLPPLPLPPLPPLPPPPPPLPPPLCLPLLMHLYFPTSAAIQLRVLELWQAMVDHHDNRQHLPLHT